MLMQTDGERVVLEAPGAPDHGWLDAALDEAYGAGTALVVWPVAVGDWSARRLAWESGFRVSGTVPGWFGPSVGERARRDAWLLTLGASDPREPATTWLDCPVLEGDLVRLRPWRAEDAPRIVEACSEERTAYWLGRLPVPYTLADAEAYLEDRRGVLADATAVGWAVADPATDELLGSLALFDLVAGRSAEVGYWTHPAARGRGVMTAAVRLAIGHAFGALGLGRLAAFAAVGNTASRHVIETCGFTYIGTERRSVLVRDGLADHACYDLLSTDLT
ncbi:GNAT family N-acetyltransferase [Nocardioides taihuensis]|uniref:GNAT family N-acetyltransferase n=1 Tax=Nocardioides taihuensis TaxID=1835606 RepID=A0ABW0BFD8_9ACTN